MPSSFKYENESYFFVGELKPEVIQFWIFLKHFDKDMDTGYSKDHSRLDYTHTHT